jgi:wyosine [tRNA(Phe)-imidazoG37] synthetase (radical SAM superfamily)
MIKPETIPSTYKYIYGPVHSWRLGTSLGLDPISRKEKVCNYDCVYCQLGPSLKLFKKRQVFVPTDELVSEVRAFDSTKIDHLTFSGRGEPTLASNLGDMIREIKKVRKEPIAIITNSSFFYCPDVRDDLSAADCVLAKLDAGTSDIFEAVDQTQGAVKFSDIVDGIRAFRQIFSGKLALQMMFVAENLHQAAVMAKIAKSINADEIEINTPTRACPARALNEKELEVIKASFEGLPAISIYERPVTMSAPVDQADTLRRRGRELPGRNNRSPLDRDA